MSPKADYQTRKDMVLGIVVNEYIKTVNPVSSGLIAHDYTLDLSPATIRNILAELEEEGLLTHPHTSAGRVPTETGYRYYVDHLMNQIQLLEQEKTRIRMEYEKNVRDLESALEKTSQVLTDLTHYTGIVCFGDERDRMICRGTSFVVGYPENPDLQKIQSILSALEEKERILSIINRDLRKKINIYIGHEMAISNMDGCSLAVTQYKLDNGTTGRIAVLGPTRMNYQRVVSALDYLTDVIERIY